MRRMTLVTGVALLCASFVALSAACDSGGVSTPPLDVTPADAGGDGPADALSRGRTLTISLDPTIDMDSDDVKATALTSADLLDTSGRITANATIVDGSAVFSVPGVAAGDYFVRVNGDADDLVPTRLDASTADVSQRIGQKLRASYVGPTSHPTHRINTWSSGQKKPSAVKFSDGTSISGEQPYVIMTLATPKVEFKVLGTAAQLTTFTAIVRCSSFGRAEVSVSRLMRSTHEPRFPSPSCGPRRRARSAR